MSSIIKHTYTLIVHVLEDVFSYALVDGLARQATLLVDLLTHYLRPLHIELVLQAVENHLLEIGLPQQLPFIKIVNNVVTLASLEVLVSFQRGVIRFGHWVQDVS